MKPCEKSKNRFKKYRNKLNALIKKSKKDYYDGRFNTFKNDMRKTWQTINNIIGKGNKSSTQSKLLNKEGHYITDPQSIANEFNDYFVNIGPKLASTISNSSKTSYCDYLHDPLKKTCTISETITLRIWLS